MPLGKMRRGEGRGEERREGRGEEVHHLLSSYTTITLCFSPSTSKMDKRFLRYISFPGGCLHLQIFCVSNISPTAGSHAHHRHQPNSRESCTPQTSAQQQGVMHTTDISPTAGSHAHHRHQPNSRESCTPQTSAQQQGVMHTTDISPTAGSHAHHRHMCAKGSPHVCIGYPCSCSTSGRTRICR